jgi:NitT/TauT family transport system substrate-binding protein
MDRRRFFYWLAGAFSGCRRQPSDLRRVRVALRPHFAQAPVYLADELGFFRECSLRVEIARFPQPMQMLPLLARGGIDVGFLAPVPGVINAITKGARIRLVATREIATPGCTSGGTIFASAKTFPRGLKDLKLLKGKRVATLGRAELTEFFLDMILDSAGMTLDDVELLTMRLSDGAAALAGGKIDALVAASFDTDLDFVSRNVVRSITSADILPNFQYTYMIFGRRLLGDTETGVRFLWAYLRGVREYQSGKTPQVFNELARAGHADATAARAACRNGLSRDGKIDRSSVQRLIDWAAKKGYIPNTVEASQLLDRRFVEEANRRLHRGWGPSNEHTSIDGS